MKILLFVVIASSLGLASAESDNEVDVVADDDDEDDPVAVVDVKMPSDLFEDPTELKQAADLAVAKVQAKDPNASAKTIATAEASVNIPDDATDVQKTQILDAIEAIVCDSDDGNSTVIDCSVEWGGDDDRRRRRRLQESAATYVITLTLDPSDPSLPDMTVIKSELEYLLNEAGSTVVIGDVTQPVVSSVTIEISADSALSEQEQAELLQAVADGAGIDVSEFTIEVTLPGGTAVQIGVRFYSKGRSCKLGYAVPTEIECQEVAASYKLGYKFSFSSTDRPQGCWVKNKSVYFNSIKGMRSLQKVWAKSKAICINEFQSSWSPTFTYKMAGKGRKWGLNCPSDDMIDNENDCKEACVEMGVGYKKKVNSKWRPGGCMARKSRCYFNSAFVSPLTKFRNRQGICKVTV